MAAYPKTIGGCVDQLYKMREQRLVIQKKVDEMKSAESALHDHIIKPEGFVIPESATAIHGISTERALREGRPVTEVLKEFSGAVRGAMCLIAHNMDFDEKMVRVELLRQEMPDVLQPVPVHQKICTMKNSTGYCKIPGPYGDKWPKLSELHIKLFEVDFEDQHNAASDVLCCAKCFFELRRRVVIV